jgi:hypothetical protein
MFKNKKPQRIKIRFFAKRNLKTAILVAVLGCFFSLNALAGEPNNDTDAAWGSLPKTDLGPWSGLFYVGATAREPFGDLFMGKFSRYGENIYALEAAYTLNQKNIIRRFFRPVFDVVQLAGNIAYRQDYINHDNDQEGNLYLIWRFTRFPWNQYLKNTVAIGDGVSYAFHAPYADVEKGKPQSDFSRFLNYLMLEITFALPSQPNFELVLRMHHRCTAWGTFPGNASAGSTNIGIGLRYYF